MNSATTMSPSNAYNIMLREYPDVMNIEQMCEVLNVSTKTGYGLIHDGKVKCIKVGRAYRIPKVHLLTYLGIANYAERQS